MNSLDPRALSLAVKEASMANAKAHRGYDTGEITAVNADQTYAVTVLGRANADASGATSYPFCAGPPGLQVGQYVMVVRSQGNAQLLPQITGVSPFRGSATGEATVYF